MQGPHIQPWLPAFGFARGARHRAAAVLLALAIALASFMHVAHSHEAEGPATYKLCSFCTTFDRGSGPPLTAPAAWPLDPLPTLVVAARAPAPVATVLRAACHPRAPPALQG
jgi:hypothetical protein